MDYYINWGLYNLPTFKLPGTNVAGLVLRWRKRWRFRYTIGVGNFIWKKIVSNGPTVIGGPVDVNFGFFLFLCIVRNKNMGLSIKYHT